MLLLQSLFTQLLPHPTPLSVPAVTQHTRFPSLPHPLLQIASQFVSSRLSKLLATALNRFPFREPATGNAVPLSLSIPPPLLSLLTVSASIQQFAFASSTNSLAAISPLDASFVLPSSGAFLRPLWKSIASSSDLATCLHSAIADGLVSDSSAYRITPLYATVFLFSVGYLRVLSTLDDQHFADSNDPFPLHLVKEIAYTCKTLVWQHIWSRNIDRPEVSKRRGRA